MDRISCALLLGSVIGFSAPAVQAQGRSVPGTAVSAFPDEDPDGDDLLNSQEAERLTNPTNENSDGDSLVDGYDAMPNHAGFTFLAASEAPCAVIVLQALPHPEAELRGINDQGDLLLVAPADSPPADEDAPRQEMAWLWRPCFAAALRMAACL